MHKFAAWITAILITGAATLVVFDEVSRPGVESEVSFIAGGKHLQGILIKPEGEGPFPVVIFIHGDGPATADEFGFLQVFSRPVIRAGYAFFSWDKPGIGGSEGSWLAQTMDDRAQEVADAATFLRGRPDIMGSEIGLMGASQAGWVLPKATQLTDFSFMIAISTAINWLRQGDYMMRLRLSRQGKGAEEINRAVECEVAVAEVYQHEDSYQEYLKMSEVLAVRCHENSREKPVSEERWLFNRNNMKADATVDLRHVDIPVLALFGDKDAHVDVYETMDTYQRELATPNQSDVTIKLFANANHALIRTEVMEPVSMMTWFMAVFLAEDALGDGVSETITAWLMSVGKQEKL